MRHLNIILLVVLSTLLFSCSSDEERISVFLSEIDIELKDDVTILSSKDWGVTDYIFEAKFSVSNLDKSRLIELIQNYENFNRETVETVETLQDQWSMAFKTDSTYELRIHTPYKDSFKEHTISVFIESNIVNFDYWVE